MPTDEIQAATAAPDGTPPPTPAESAVAFAALAATRRDPDIEEAGRPDRPAAAAVASAEQAAPSFAEIIQYTFSHRSATAGPTQNPGQSASGVVTGNLNARAGNGAALSYTVALDPANGRVTLGPDGSFVYSANSGLAQSGGTDSFRVTIDNGSPFRLDGIGGAIQGILAGLAQLIGLRQPDTVTVTVPVTIAALSLDADGTLSAADLDALARAGAVGATVNDAGLVTALVGGFTGSKIDDAADALEVLNRLRGLLGAQGNLTGDITKSEAGDASNTYYRFTPRINGVPVLGGEIILTTMRDGTATGVFSGIDPRVYGLSTTPDAVVSDGAEAVAAARRILQDRLTSPPAGLLESLSFDSQLVIFAADPAVAPALAWQVKVGTTNPAADTGLPGVTLFGPQFSTTYYIYANGANTGTLLTEQDGTEGAALAWQGQSRIGWTESGLNDAEFTINYVGIDDSWAMIDPERGIVVYVGARRLAEGYLDVGVPLTVPKNPISFARGWFDHPSAVSAMGNVAKAYDFFTALGAALPAQINVALLVPKGPIPAFGIVATVPEAWYGDTADGGGILQFGDGAEGALDLVAHEMTHAVISSIVGVDGFSGFEGDALDEAFGDIMGSLIENKSDDGRWKFSEDAPIRAENGDEFSLRTMERISDLYTVEGDPGEKYDKSTEFSHAVYKMMTDARTAGISRDTWARIFLSTMQRLPKNATFELARSAVIGAALDQEIFGDQLKAIADAFNDVGIRVEDPRVKVVLRWNATPADLDARLTAGGTDGPDAGILDQDDRDGNGPESITLDALTPGDYYFAVNDISNVFSTNSTALSKSGATVEVFTPDLIETDATSLFGYLFRYVTGNIPTTFEVDGASAGTRWDVFKLTIPATEPGTVPNPVVTPIDRYSYLITVNQSPVAGDAIVESVNPLSGEVTGRVRASDPDGDPLTFSISNNPAQGRAGVDSSTGSFLYEPSRAAREAASANYEVTALFTGLNAPSRVVVGQGDTIYLVKAGAVATVDTSNGATVTGSTPTGPFSVDLVEANPSRTRAYFTTTGAGLLGVLTPATNTIAPFKDFGQRIPRGIGFSPDGNLVYVATVDADQAGTLSVVNATNGAETATVPLGSSASAIAVSPNGSRIYVPGITGEGTGVVNIVDSATRTVTTISGLDSPNDIAVSPDGTRLFVTTNSESGGRLRVYNIADTTPTLLANVAVASGLAGYLATNADGTRVFVSTWDPARGTSAIAVVTSAGTVVRNIEFPANAMPFPALSNDGTRLYVADKVSTLSEINIGGGTTTDTFEITVSDGRGGTDTVRVAVPITPLT